MSRACTRPFVDRPVGDVEAATSLARQVARRYRLPEPRLLRVGMNALFRAGDVVVRVGRQSAPAELGIELAVALRAAGITVPVPAADEATVAGELGATCWRAIEPCDQPIDWRRVGSMIRGVHAIRRQALPAGYPIPSPVTFPWWSFDALLADFRDEIDPAALAGIEAMIDRHRGWDVMDPAAVVVCHGDVHPGNVMMTDEGPVLLDWDLMCRALPGWDHAMLVTLAERWGGDPAVYPAFAAGYGRDLAADPDTRRFADLRNVAATLMRVGAGRTDAIARREAQRRLAYWRRDPDAPAWQAQ